MNKDRDYIGISR